MQEDKAHHHSVSPFCQLPIDMVKGFPLEYMHLACLGVMRKLLLLWTKGPRKFKISSGQVTQISYLLKSLGPYIPNCFARKPRDLEELERWKATELRQFALYTGKVVLRGILEPDIYEHFLSLSVALTLLANKQTASTHHAYARSLLQYFVAQGHTLYGPEFLVYNVHGLLHLADDVQTYGFLDNYSAFPFENYMQKLKKMARSGKNPLIQIVKRLAELERSRIEVEPRSKRLKLLTRAPNNVFNLDGDCCEVIAPCSYDMPESSDIKYKCRIYTKSEALFDIPCDSRLIGAFKVDVNHFRTEEVLESALVTKAIFVKGFQGTKNIFMTLRHDYDQ